MYDDLHKLRKEKTLRPSSNLLALSPTVREDGLLRLGSLIRREKLPNDSRHSPLDLLAVRLNSYSSPFSHVAVDHFWSMEIV